MYIYIPRISLSLFNIEYQPNIAQAFEDSSLLNIYFFLLFLKELYLFEFEEKQIYKIRFLLSSSLVICISS